MNTVQWADIKPEKVAKKNNFWATKWIFWNLRIQLSATIILWFILSLIGMSPVINFILHEINMICYSMHLADFCLPSFFKGISSRRAINLLIMPRNHEMGNCHLVCIVWMTYTPVSASLNRHSWLNRHLSTLFSKICQLLNVLFSKISPQNQTAGGLLTRIRYSV